MNLLSVVKGAFVALVLTGGAAQATTVDFSGASGSLTVGNETCLGFGCSETVTFASGIPSAFSLAEGESVSFDFLEIAVDGFGIGTFDIDGFLGYATPGVIANFSGSAAYGTFFGQASVGVLLWDDAVQTVTLADGSAYTFALDQGVSLGLGNTATIGATVTLDTVPAPVPLPASALLLLAGVGGIGVMRMRRKAAA